jgi:NAD+ synthase (glutamine-hydrolysing)
LKKVVIGVSGGLDSTHALLVCARVMDKLKLPRTNILAYTMPGFATSERTLKQAHALMKLVGCTAQEIDIRPSCLQMLKDLGHPYAEGKEQYDITFENVQAGERTNHLFRLANHNAALVIGTGDLSELALGWCTYGVGDHMSHYNVNASVPKTLISHLVRWVAESGVIGRNDAQAARYPRHRDQPELVPGTADGQPEQRTESTIGPYELQDFNLYYVLRFGFNPPRWRSCRTRPGRTRSRAAGRMAITSRATSTTCRPSRRISASSSTASSAPASSSAAACRTRRRSAAAVRCRRVATGARPAMPKALYGWRNCAPFRCRSK